MSTSTHCKDTGTLEPASSPLYTLTIARVKAKAHAKQLHTLLEHSAGQSQCQRLYSPLRSPSSGTHRTKRKHRLAGQGGSVGARMKARLREILGKSGTPRQRGSLAGYAGNAGG